MYEAKGIVVNTTNGFPRVKGMLLVSLDGKSKSKKAVNIKNFRKLVEDDEVYDLGFNSHGSVVYKKTRDKLNPRGLAKLNDLPLVELGTDGNNTLLEQGFDVIGRIYLSHMMNLVAYRVKAKCNGKCKNILRENMLTLVNYIRPENVKVNMARGKVTVAALDGMSMRYLESILIDDVSEIEGMDKEQGEIESEV